MSAFISHLSGACWPLSLACVGASGPTACLCCCCQMQALLFSCLPRAIMQLLGCYDIPPQFQDCCGVPALLCAVATVYFAGLIAPSSVCVCACLLLLACRLPCVSLSVCSALTSSSKTHCILAVAVCICAGCDHERLSINCGGRCDGILTCDITQQPDTTAEVRE